MDLHNTKKMAFPSCFILILIILTILSGALDLFEFFRLIEGLSFSENYPQWLPDLFPWIAGIKLELIFCVFT